MFVAKNNKMAIIDTEEDKFVVPFEYGPIKIEIDAMTNEVYFVRLMSDTTCELKRPFKSPSGLIIYRIYDEYGRKIRLGNTKKTVFFDGCKGRYYDNYEDYCICYHFFENDRKVFVYPKHKKDDSYEKVFSRDYLIEHKIDSLLKKYKNYEKITSDKWNAMSSFKYGLAVIYKDGEYGLIDNDYNIIIPCDKNIENIKILNDSTVELKNIKGEYAIYKINSGFIFDFTNDISYDDVELLDDNIYKFRFEDNNQDIKYKFAVGNKVNQNMYKQIYTDTYHIICEDNENTFFFDKNGILLFELNSHDFYKSKKEVFYKENNKIYSYNLETKIKKEIKVTIFQDEKGNIIDHQKLDGYNFYHENSDNMITLFKNMKHGIELDSENGIKVYRWFDELKKAYLYEKLLLENIFAFENVKRLAKKGSKKNNAKSNK